MDKKKETRSTKKKFLLTFWELLSGLIRRNTAVEKSLALNKATLQAITDAVLVTDNAGKVVDYNDKYVDYFGSGHETTGPDAMKFLLTLLVDPDELQERLVEIKGYPHQKSSDEFALKDHRVFEFHSQPLLLNNEIIGRVWSLRDITAQKQLQNQLMRHATHDLLTHTPNRSLLEDRINQAILQCAEAQTEFALLSLDIDRFKFINDSYGHAVGDRLLKTFVKRCQDNLRVGDTIARLSGDEFVILLASIKSVDEATSITQQIQTDVTKEYLIDEQLIKISISIGISIFPKDGADCASLLRSSNIAMLRAKEIVTNSFSFYEKEMNQHARMLLEIENHLQTAIQNKELMIVYQPTLNLHTGKIFGTEALIRWQHPKLGMIPASVFIPIAETSGTIIALGDWVLASAFTQLKQWHDMGLTGLRMAVNLSLQQLKQVSFIENMEKLLKATGVNTGSIDLELTESLFFGNQPDVAKNMHSLTEMGMTLVLDDFGMGYSSLSYLETFPIKKLKIDKTFISSISPNKRNIAITSAIISMAKSLDIKVLAEGVDNITQYEYLKAQGCDELQGYLFSEALPAGECQELLVKYRDHHWKPM